MLHDKAWLLAIAVLLSAAPASAETDNSQAPAATAPPALATAPQGTLTPVVGRHIRDADGNDVGRVWDVLVDADGNPHAAVIDYGGVLGVGKRKVAVAWSALKFGMSNSSDDVTLSLTKEQMGAIPDFHYSGGDATVGSSGGS
jgi:hypothetical protein